MNTTVVIKTNKKLRDQAKRTAHELGIPLTTVMNALLKQFVREREITISLDPAPNPKKIALWEKISAEADKELKHAKRYTDAEELIKDLKLA